MIQIKNENINKKKCQCCKNNNFFYFMRNNNQIIYIYNKALDTRKKSFADYIDHFKPHEISPNSVGVAIDVYTSKDDHTNLDFIDVSFEVTNAEVDNVTEKLKSLSFVEPEQTSYAY